jgi:hypothetical protein
MWLDADQEPEYAKAFEFDNKNKIVVLNPGKRKRYFEHPGDMTFNSIKTSVEKIVGGEARFVRVELP